MASGVRNPLFLTVLGGVIALDFVTKVIAEASLTRIPVPLVGDWLRLQLVYNPGAAFGLNVGAHSRWVFTVLALVALFVLISMVRQTPPDQKLKLISLALISAGAIGNLVNRLMESRGVVDFIDVGIGALRWPTFNVADMAVTLGALALAVVLWREGRNPEALVSKGAGAQEAS